MRIVHDNMLLLYIIAHFGSAGNGDFYVSA